MARTWGGVTRNGSCGEMVAKMARRAVKTAGDLIRAYGLFRLRHQTFRLASNGHELGRAAFKYQKLVECGSFLAANPVLLAVPPTGIGKYRSNALGHLSVRPGGSPAFLFDLVVTVFDFVSLPF